MDREKREPEKPKSKAKPPQKWWQLFLCPSEDFLCRKSQLLAAVSIIITLLVTPSFTVDTPPYRLGEIADQNIKAKRDFLIEDEDATLKKRDEAVRHSPVVYDLDTTVAEHTREKLRSAFLTLRESLNEPASSLAPVPNNLLQSLPVESPDELISPSLKLPRLSVQPDRKAQSFKHKNDLETLLGFAVPDDIFANLVEKKSSAEIEEKVNQLVQASLESGVVSNKAWLLQAQGEPIIIRKGSAQEEHLLPPPHSFPDLDETRKLVRMQALEKGRDIKEMTAIAFLASELLQPNLNFNFEETERRREEAYAGVKPTFIHLKKNEMLVREGQRIGPEEILKLKGHEHEQSRRMTILVILTLFLFTAICIYVVVQVTQQHIHLRPLKFNDFLFLGVMLLALLILARFGSWMGDIVGEHPAAFGGRTLIYAIPLAAGAMMTSIFFGVTVSFIFSLLLNLFAAMILGRDFGLYCYFLIGSFVAAQGVAPCSNRMTPIRAGLQVGAVNVALIVLYALLQDQFIFFKIVLNAFFGLCGGIFAGILTTGFTPLVETLFGYTTDMKLMELATMDQPLLQELMVQAPGTYHHSIIVGNLAEAAAKSIGANAQLAKVAAYYHDIGKIKKPLYFIENQFECENRHEKLAPSMSSLILTAHVKDGVELARQYRLGRPIIDIIGQHHGQSLISFFYKKALSAREKMQNNKGADLPPIDIDDFRYPGPKPQTKEAGLVMLGDIVEAACRTLTDPTPARIQGLVNRLINNAFTDGQLDECELTLKDIHEIAKHFNQILATVHHKRIEYPSMTSNNDGKAKTDASDSNQREPRPDRDRPAAHREGGKPDIKRLGIH